MCELFFGDTNVCSSVADFSVYTEICDMVIHGIVILRIGGLWMQVLSISTRVLNRIRIKMDISAGLSPGCVFLSNSPYTIVIFDWDELTVLFLCFGNIVLSHLDIIIVG